MENLSNLFPLVERSITTLITAVVILYGIKKMFKDEPLKNEKVIENNTTAMNELISQIKYQREDYQEIHEEMKRNRELGEKTLTTVKVSDEKDNFIIRLLLKNDPQDAEDVIREIEERKG